LKISMQRLFDHVPIPYERAPLSEVVAVPMDLLNFLSQKGSFGFHPVACFDVV